MPEECEFCEFKGTAAELENHLFFKALTHDPDHDQELRKKLTKITQEGAWPSQND